MFSHLFLFMSAVRILLFIFLFHIHNWLYIFICLFSFLRYITFCKFSDKYRKCIWNSKLFNFVIWVLWFLGKKNVFILNLYLIKEVEPGVKGSLYGQDLSSCFPLLFSAGSFHCDIQEGCSSSGHHACIPVIWNKEGMEKDIFLLYLWSMT